MSTLVVGTNSYVTREEADTYIKTFYLSSDAVRVSWESLSPEDQEALLARSLLFIEMLPYVGFKSDPEQVLSFPRSGQKEVPEDVKRAQIIEAVSDFDEDTVKYRSIRQNGIRSFTIGGLTEMFFKSAKPGDALSNLSPTTKAILDKYMSGGYEISCSSLNT